MCHFPDTKLMKIRQTKSKIPKVKKPFYACLKSNVVMKQNYTEQK